MHRLPALERAKEQTLSAPPPAPSGRHPPAPWLISGLTAAADQLTKLLILASFAPGESLPLIPGVLHLTLVENTGAAFGLLKGQQALFIGLSVVVIVWIIRELLAKPAMAAAAAWGCALILGGAVGNLIDRLRWGHVVDFIDLRVWPVFNVGDSAITIGVALLILRALRPPNVPGTFHSGKRAWRFW